MTERKLWRKNHERGERPRCLDLTAGKMKNERHEPALRQSLGLRATKRKKINRMVAMMSLYAFGQMGT